MDWKLATTEAEDLLARYETEPSHTRHVAALAAQLFQGLQPLHKRDEDFEGRLLHLAGLLHDVGWSQTSTGEGHHKFSAQLIAAHPWRGLDAREVALVAQIARYHRKSLPKTEHTDYVALEFSDRQRVDELGGILRVADALDRKHLLLVGSVETEITEQAITLWVRSTGPWEEEREMVRKKKDLLERALRREVLV
jgi:exopolyphosphatase/guanosine-5'-triphosphate,3'-diphosphate pyrophosphatase